jgi:hypothetical protein
MQSDKYDIDILNNLYQDSTLAIPYRRYSLLTREDIRDPDNHFHYLRNDEE